MFNKRNDLNRRMFQNVDNLHSLWENNLSPGQSVASPGDREWQMVNKHPIPRVALRSARG